MLLEYDTDIRRSPLEVGDRPRVEGKALYVGAAKFAVRGVTYGTFGPGEGGLPFPDREVAARDLRAMVRAGINAFRTYTVPPAWLLDLAAAEGLRVLVGIDWEDHMAVLEDRRRQALIRARIAQTVRDTAGHPGVLCYLLGNEIPSPIVRWYGPRRMERFLGGLHGAAKQEDPAAIVTYANYPGSEYLGLPFLDVVSFNVYLERERELGAYLAHLQTMAGDRPLLITETGLDSRRNGRLGQADTLSWQIRAVAEAGCAGICVFAWTDEWYRGGVEIDDWDFGLVDRERRPKPALAAVSDAYRRLPLSPDPSWPKASVIVCAYNAEPTLEACLRGVEQLRYHDYEVIVVDDGSTDRTAEIARAHGARLLSTENRGLACARNTGLAMAEGEIVAYLDSDAYPDPDWLTYLVAAFERGTDAAVGGPNIPPPDDRGTAECVACAPGGPIHVLLDDRRAEHIPGCNMAFRRRSLESVDGFDPRFRIAGDDVDLCWRIDSRGWSIGFSPGAVVLHKRRDSVRGYLKQQYEYGKAEAQLERKWPERYNRLGHCTWTGKVYGGSTPSAASPRRWRIYYGTWGTGLFQSIYHRGPGLLSFLPLLPEWNLVVVGLLLLSILAVEWTPLIMALPLLLLAVGLTVAEAARAARTARVGRDAASPRQRRRLRALIGVLFLLQPAARLAGRLRAGLSPWRRPERCRRALPRPRTVSLWSESWRSGEVRLRAVEKCLRDDGARVWLGGVFDRWDLDVRGGLLGAARLRMVLEEHGSGRQMVRFRMWPRCSAAAAVAALVAAGVAVIAFGDRAPDVGAAFAAIPLALITWTLRDCALAAGVLAHAVRAASDQLATDLVVQGLESGPDGEPSQPRSLAAVTSRIEIAPVVGQTDRVEEFAP